MARDGSEIFPERNAEASLDWLWRAHLSLVATGALLVLVLVKVLAVSHGNVTTAIAVLGAAGPAEVGLSIALTLGLPFVAGAYAIAICIEAVTQARTGRLPRIHVAFLAWLTAVSLSVAPTYVPFMTVVVIAAVVAIAAHARKKGRRRRREFPPDRPPKSPRWLLVSPLFVMILLASFDTMWLPSHVLRVGNEPEFAGYVLDESDDYATVLRQRDRAVVRLERASLTFVELCHPDGLPKPGRPFFYRFDREPDATYRPCSEVDRPDATDESQDGT